MSQGSSRTQRLHRLAGWMNQVGGVLTVLVMVLVSYDVTARQLFNSPFHGTAELAATALVLIVFLQVPQAIVEDKLLRVTFLFDRLGPRARRALNVLAWLAGAIVFGALAATSWTPLTEGFRTNEFYGMDSFRIPAWPLRVVTFVLWTIGALVCLYLALAYLRGRTDAAGNAITD